MKHEKSNRITVFSRKKIDQTEKDQVGKEISKMLIVLVLF